MKSIALAVMFFALQYTAAQFSPNWRGSHKLVHLMIVLLVFFGFVVSLAR